MVDDEFGGSDVDDDVLIDGVDECEEIVGCDAEDERCILIICL